MAMLYANENFPRQATEWLRALGHDVLTTADTGKAGQAISDADVLAFAVRLGRAIVTLNRRDFMRLHGEAPNHAGIIVCTQDPDTEGQARRIHAAISVGSLNGQLVRVNRPQT
jgi:hypothetical protein